MTRKHLVIFARMPQRGRVKRRLAAGIGDAAALAFYRGATGRLLRTMARDRRWTTHLAMTPDRAASGPRFWPVARALRRRQGQGDLGARMARPMRELPPGPVVIVGSDIPALAPRHVAAAFRALGGREAVFGPSDDGGYWLVGFRRSPCLPAALFRNVRWSTEHALADTLAGLPRRMRVAMLEMLEDIDDSAAYERWRTRSRRTVESRGSKGVQSN